tara:strand:+ start:1138 stop:1254 length:117 start_codon:yes stop_codon:yes gene_type:complete
MFLEGAADRVFTTILIQFIIKTKFDKRDSNILEGNKVL